ncbi:MAG: PAAR domain-containing protein, partial [Candidatus Zixiibacteriota bacterium]
ILPPGAATVFIGGVPAACVGDMATCVGPPDTIAPPGCPTVLISPAGGGGGGGGAGGGGGTATTEEAAGTGGGGSGENELASSGDQREDEGHFLDVRFVDRGGFPVTGPGFTSRRSG